MNELRLIFTRNGDALSCQLTTSWGDDLGDARPFVPFLSSDDDEDLRWYLEEYMDLPVGGALVRARRIELSLADWGRELFRAVFDEEGHRELFSALVDPEAPRLLLTVASQDLDVLRLPWELMADSRGPLTQQGVTIRRQLETARRSKKYQIGKLPLRILLVVSRPDDSGFLDPRGTTRATLEALDPLGEGVVVDFCRPATQGQMERMLGDADGAGRPYHIVHFDGHGSFDPVRQTSVLYFERPGLGGKLMLSDEVEADRFGALMAQRRVPLVILEACRSGQVGNAMAFRGVAPALIEAGVGSVLAMSHAVHVEAAKVLLARFYAELAGGATVGQALEQGRAALVEKPERWLRRAPGEPAVALSDWFLPQLYQLGEDTVLVPGGAENAPRSTTTPEGRRAPAQGPEAGAFPAEPMYGFFGRAHELHRLERRFQRHRVVVLHAMGGMGKTSLAREAAFWWTSRTGLFPDGACFVSFEQAGGAQRAVQVIGAYFEGAEFEKRSGEEQRRRAKELFQTKRVLVVWDNFESVLPAFQEGEVVAPYPEEERAAIHALFGEWTEGEQGLGRLLVTCRPVETGLGAVCTVELAGLARADALSMLHGVMQKAGVEVAHERDALVGLLNAVARHPLSIELVGPHLKEMAPEAIVADFQVLLDKLEGEAEEGRNRSLKASIEFSLKRLSAEAREAVKWLGLFRGGVFEDNLLWVSRMEAGVWNQARRELEATALVRVEREIECNGRPYLRFHPTLAHVVDAGEADAGVRERYVQVYLAMGIEAHKALRGSNPRWGMEVMVREEANLWRAVSWALEAGVYDRASAMSGLLRDFLERSGRAREAERWAARLAEELRKGGFSHTVAVGEMDEAAALLSQGEPRKAIEKLEALVARLRTTTEFDATFALGMACLQLGRAYYRSGWAQKAIPVLRDAVQQWTSMVGKAQAAGENGEVERLNLAGVLGDLSNALGDTGAFDEARRAVEQGIAICRERENHHGIATLLGISAAILTKQGHFAEADARYEDVIQIALQSGDRALAGQALMNQGLLAYEARQFDRAARLFRRALLSAQEIGDETSIMLICSNLGLVEMQGDRFIEARTWLERAREIAIRRADHRVTGATLLNLASVCECEGEAARNQGDEATARQRFTEAARLAGECLARGNQDEPTMAKCHYRLGEIHHLLGDLDKAEEHIHLAREIHERLGLQEAWIDYNLLAAIARARGSADELEAASWEKKRDALVAEIEHRAGAPALPQYAVQGITALAAACARAGLEGTPLDADEEEALVRFADPALWPAPFDTLAPFFRALSTGTLAALPSSLPPQLASVLTPVLDAVIVELGRRAGAPTLPQQSVQIITEVAIACARAGLERTPLTADVEDALAHFANPTLWPAPFDTLAPFFRALSSETPPTIPESLPLQLASVLAPVLDALVAERDRRAASGDPPPVAAPCPCGSGKPFLDCHGAESG